MLLDEPARRPMLVCDVDMGVAVHDPVPAATSGIPDIVSEAPTVPLDDLKKMWWDVLRTLCRIL